MELLVEIHVQRVYIGFLILPAPFKQILVSLHVKARNDKAIAYLRGKWNQWGNLLDIFRAKRLIHIDAAVDKKRRSSYVAWPCHK